MSPERAQVEADIGDHLDEIDRHPVWVSLTATQPTVHETARADELLNELRTTNVWGVGACVATVMIANSIGQYASSLTVFIPHVDDGFAVIRRLTETLVAERCRP